MIGDRFLPIAVALILQGFEGRRPVTRNFIFAFARRRIRDSLAERFMRPKQQQMMGLADLFQAGLDGNARCLG